MYGSATAETDVVTAEALGTPPTAPEGTAGNVTPIGARGAARLASVRSAGGRLFPEPLASEAHQARAVPPPAPRGGEAPDMVRAENDALHMRLARLSRVTQGLASDLAATRRESRRQELEIAALRSENDELRRRTVRAALAFYAPPGD